MSSVRRSGRDRPSSQSQGTGTRGRRKTQETDDEPTQSSTAGTSRRNKKQSRISDFLEESQEEGGTQKASKVPQITNDQVLEQARSVAFYMISCCKDNSIVNRTDVTKEVLKNFHFKHYPTIMAKASEILKEVFGLEIKNLDGDDDKFDKMILIDTQSIPKYASSEEDKATLALLFLVLSCIQVSGEAIKEEDLINFLRELNILYSKQDPNFGDVEGKVNTFKGQAYLRFDVDKSTNPPTKMIALGPRAKAEINKVEMLRFLKKVYPDLDFLSDNANNLADSQDEGALSE
ncbi:melanoma-associated antigen B2-like [Neocloeon triangulifer]|uniref:melanoma-associated antigen B2-like n=1 Tax=Neocloeon triangulifer TaxID=2078957 RepID=UPI00286FA2EE|nr:melanoma-associated antigen B2-like [Neocloeon triangulifer]